MALRTSFLEPVIDPVMRLFGILSHRPDTEHVAIILRFGMIVALWAFVAFDYLFLQKIPAGGYEQIFMATSLYGLALALESTHLAFSPNASSGRRLMAIWADQVLLTYFAFILGPTGTVLYPFYLWNMLAAGFRYGTVYLLISAISIVAVLSVHYHIFELWQTSYLVCLLQISFVIILAFSMTSFLNTIRQAIATAEAASSAKSAFLAGISHEVRTPLQAIKGLSDLLDDTRLDTDQRRMVGTISQAGDTLLGLINYLLDYARAENGTMPVNDDDFDLSRLLGRLHRLFSEQMRQKHLDLNINFDSSLRRLYRGNERFLEDILTNLMGNAVKFTHQGQITLRARLVEENSQMHRICFEVIDTGIGIAPEAQQRIFDRFTQSDDDVMAQFGGSGLGLALCRQYAELMGGHIQVASKQGEGSTFAFTAPFGLALKHSQTATAEDESEETPKRSIMMITRNQQLVTMLPPAVPYCDVHHDLRTALTALTSFCEDQMPSVVVIDRQGLECDIALTQMQIASCSRSGLPFVLWICRADEQASNLALVHPQHGLAFLNRTDWHYRMSKLLRLAEQLHGHGSVRSASRDTEISEPAESLQILVAEDNRTNQMVLERMLASLGHQVTLAENGKQAIAAIRNRKFDLAFLDIRMPVLDGLETARRIEALAGAGDLQHPPHLYALTADPGMEIKDRCLQAGMKACLLKPVDRYRLKELLDIFIEQKQQIADNRKTITISDNWGLEEMYTTQIIEDLRDLGGDQFVVDLAHQFSEDGIAALHRLHDAVNHRDDAEFRDGAHALRSAAANIGARSVFDLCLSWRDMTAAELDQEGSGHMVQLAANLSEAITDLEHILSVSLPKPEAARQSSYQKELIVNH